MKKLRPALLSLALILSACSTSLPATDAVPRAPASPLPVARELTPESLPDSPALPIPKFASTLQIPLIDQPPNGNEATITPAYEGCGYQWAQQDLPVLSREFQQAIQGLEPSAQANAFAFGEDCIYADGHKTFGAKETDFNVTLQVADLSNEASLGEWIVKIMLIVVNIPKEKIVGPQSGVVFINFQSGSDQKNLNFYIDQYQTLPSGLTTAEIYQALQTPQ
jgi:hypothetical protein